MKGMLKLYFYILLTLHHYILLNVLKHIAYTILETSSCTLHNIPFTRITNNGYFNLSFKRRTPSTFLYTPSTLMVLCKESPVCKERVCGCLPSYIYTTSLESIIRKPHELVKQLKLQLV